MKNCFDINDAQLSTFPHVFRFYNRPFVFLSTQKSLTDVAKFGDGDGADVLGEMIECSCSGIMACSTCHVVVHSDWFEKVGRPTEAEEDMIDLAYNAQETSRLGCQVILKPNLENAIFKIPRGANNMMDFIPFEDE